jgi:hypothetical protein
VPIRTRSGDSTRDTPTGRLRVRASAVTLTSFLRVREAFGLPGVGATTLVGATTSVGATTLVGATTSVNRKPLVPGENSLMLPRSLVLANGQWEYPGCCHLTSCELAQTHSNRDSNKLCVWGVLLRYAIYEVKSSLVYLVFFLIISNNSVSISFNFSFTKGPNLPLIFLPSTYKTPQGLSFIFS